MMSEPSVSRRAVLRRAGSLAAAFGGLGLLAACGGQPQAPAAASPPAAASTPVAGGGAAAKPTAASGAQPVSTSAAPPTAGAAAAPTTATTPPTPAPVIGGTKGGTKLTVWIDADYIPVTTDKMGSLFDAFGKSNNAEIEFDVKSNMGDQLNASVQAGTPPDIWRSYDYQCQYWNAQGQALDVSTVIDKYKGQQGGMFDYVLSTITAGGKAFAVPYSVNAWPMHVRQDVFEKVGGGKWPETWDDFRASAKEVTKAPDFYAFGWTLGKTNDANNHFIAALWTHGGKLQNDDGTFGLKPNDPAAIAALELAKNMYDVDKTIPPASVQWDDGGNNTAYQSGQVAVTSNPTSIYGWLVRNKPDLAKNTTFQGYPKGPAGTFGQVDVTAVTAAKNTKAADLVRGALDYLIKPDNHKQYIDALQGRYLPIYQAMLDDPLWQTPLYKAYTEIAKTGRIMAYSAAPAKGYADFATRLLIGTMMQDLIVRKQTPQAAYQTFYQAAKAVYANY